MRIDKEFLAQMCEAAQLLQTEGPMAATAMVQRALHGASTAADASPYTDWTTFLPQAPELLDINLPHTPHAEAQPNSDALARSRGPVRGKWAGMSARQPIEDVEVCDVPDAGADVSGKGRFITSSCTNHAGTRTYKLYIPSGYKDEEGDALPLIVMLHGCTQNPDDFAAGTGMNAVAEESNCFVVYPAQTQNANGSQCWNWFQPGDQRRDRGEPAILADITREIARRYKIDTSRIYVAGLSAGGAMAVVLAATYPELYAAVGIHSGLPYAIAHDLPTAFAAMRHRKPKAGAHDDPLAHPLQPKAPVPLGKSVPAIVFHGDCDATVAPVNGDQVLVQCVPAVDDKEARIDVQQGMAPNGRTYTRTVVHDGQGRAIAEKWTVHGAGHAWSGGSGKGSYTDPKGPNASREMLRFFLSHRQA
jgi:poly(hydroxyalkanoate) depolymerase family esterase